MEKISSAKVTQLRCEYLENPTAIDTKNLRLSWIMKSCRRGAGQTAYQIRVSSSLEKLKANKADMWDSGKVKSCRSNQIEYRGKALKSRIQCFWKVRIWDERGYESAWSKPAQWSMGLLAKSDFKAKWIQYDTGHLNQDPDLHLPPSPYFRKAFSVSKKIDSARLYISAKGLFEASINGKRVGRDYFTPGWTSYHKRIYYMTYDVTKMLKKGDNAIGAILASGWYAGYVGFKLHLKMDDNRAFYGEVPALFAQLEIDYTDGSRDTISTDKSWKASTGPILTTELYMGEHYDARLEQKGWDRAKFDDSNWQKVTVTSVDIRPQAYPAIPVKKIQEITPVKMTKRSKDTYIFNMGQNFAGWVRIKVNGKAGTRITIRHAEMLHQDGSLMTENLRSARCTDVYIKKSDNEEIWEPRFTFHGFQYVELSGLTEKPTGQTVTGIVAHSALAMTSSFECSNTIVNKLYSNITWTQRANFFEVPTDCPQRDERLGWTGDAQVYCRSATYNMDVSAFFTKWLRDLEDDQLDSGAFPDFAPLPFKVGPGYSPAWMDAGIICPWTIYQVYGDSRIITDHWAAMEKLMDFQLKRSKGYLCPADGNSFGDWLAFGKETPKDFIATVYFAYDAKLMTEMAQAIGRVNDMKKYKVLYEKIRDALLKTYIAKDGRVKGETQSTYTMLLDMGLLPKDLQPKAVRHLVRLIKANNNHLATGFLGIKHLLPVLTRWGYIDLAYELLTKTTFPSWGYPIVNGATTIWERWNSYTKEKGFETPEMNSFCHYAFGSVCEWLFRRMAGIDMLEAGFQQILIKPIPSKQIPKISASYDSIYGTIQTAWAIESRKFTLDVSIPANTTAKVYLPTNEPDTITESGKPVDSSRSIEFDAIEDHRSVLNIGSGSYHFQCSFES